tara:strand:- start:612 stop:1241 length:630 start_codon:yes stop_codon:yes gene_type:complete
MNRNPEIEIALNHLRQDDNMKILINYFGPITLKNKQNHFKSLVRSIIHQQLSGKAAKTIENRFLALYDGSVFPNPEEVLKTPSESMQNIGLSKMKTKYIQGLAKKIDGGEIRLEELSTLSDDEIAKILKPIKGIGQWTIDMFLIFSLNRLDVFPINDLGIKKGLMILLGREKFLSEKSMISRSKKWKPYRTIASLYIWKVVDEGMILKP